MISRYGLNHGNGPKRYPNHTTPEITFGECMYSVLVFDPRKDGGAALESILEDAVPGATITTAGSWEEALETAREDRPQVAVLNVERESVAEAIELCRRLKSDDGTVNIPVVVVGDSDAGRDESIGELLRYGGTIVRKPLEAEEFGQRIRCLCELQRVSESLRDEKAHLEHVLEERTAALQHRTYELDKRVKELNCLFSISDLRERPGITLEEILQEAVELIPPSWQYPHLTCARIIMGYQEFSTKNFRETPWKLSRDINVHGEWAGTLEVCSLTPVEGDEGAFLEEEKFLLNALAERFGRIAERVHAEDALRGESENITNILKSMEDLVYKVNEVYDIEYTNPALERVFGPVDTRKCYEYFRGRQSVCEQCGNEDVFRGKTVRREWYFAKNQKTYDVLETPLGNPDGSTSKLSIMRDLTAIKQAQKTLEERELLYRNVTQFIAEGAVMVQGGKVLFANRTFVEMFGYDAAKGVEGQDILLLFDQEYRELFRRVFDPLEHDETLGVSLRGVCMSREGRKFWVSVKRSIITVKSEPAILATMRDVTEEVLWEMDVQEESDYLRRENIKLRSTIKERYRFGKIVGKSVSMQNVYELILKAAGSDANVIILGESGTGKELVARAIHEMSPYADRAFVPVNCGAIPENLVESEFFGHRKGAFTGAHIDKTGYLHTANGGTLFLDEVGELGLNMQVKLLRAIETGEYTPLGDTHVRKSSMRIIAATNRDFSGMVSQGLIRQDFYYRISVLPMVLPPLREKREDIPLLVEHFLRMYCKDRKLATIPGKIMEILNNHEWPGNVRELQGVIQRYLAVGNFHFLNLNGNGYKEEEDVAVEADGEEADLRRATEFFERRFILSALNRNRWHRGKAATALKIDPKTLYMKMKKMGLS